MGARKTASAGIRNKSTKKTAAKGSTKPLAQTKTGGKAGPTRTVRTDADRSPKGTNKPGRAVKTPAKPKTTIATVSKQITTLSSELEALVHLPEQLATLSIEVEALAHVPERITALFEKLDALAQIVARAFTVASEPDAAPRPAVDVAAFDAELLTILAQLDRGGRYAGMVPIPEVREAFLRRGWTRRGFDHRLLQAERDFVVDLKTADDPSRLSDPELAIEEPGRGHLQYVVLR